jgi:hypothetical protein
MNFGFEFAISLLKPGKTAFEVARMRNTVVYTGYDLLAALATSDKYLNGMYIEFTNGVDRSYYDALEDAGYAGDLGYVRVPIALEPLFSSTDGGTNYQSNKATLVAVTDPVSASKNAVIDGTSQFFTVALVHIPDINDASQDIVYNAAVIKNSGVFAPITKTANIQVGIQATAKFEETP